MDVSLPDGLVELIDDWVRDGAYGSRTDVIAGACSYWPIAMQAVSVPVKLSVRRSRRGSKRSKPVTCIRVTGSSTNSSADCQPLPRKRASSVSRMSGGP